MAEITIRPLNDADRAWMAAFVLDRWGSALIAAAKDAAQAAGCTRLWLITTNDNLHALRFYQKRGFELVAVHRRALDESRKLKPEIPQMGKFNIPLRDEIELEMSLSKHSM